MSEKTIMPFEEFETYIEAIREIHSLQDDIHKTTTAFNDASKECMCLCWPTMEDYVVKLLKREFNDVGEWISYFIYEKEFGKAFGDDAVTDKNGNPIPFRTVQDLYNLLLDNMNEARKEINKDPQIVVMNRQSLLNALNMDIFKGKEVMVVSISSTVNEAEEMERLISEAHFSCDTNSLADRITATHYSAFADTDDDSGISDFIAKNMAIALKMIDTKNAVIIVQCDAGKSRSAGVAAALLKFYHNDDRAVFDSPYFTPNIRCYRKVLDALNELNEGEN